MGRKRKSEAAHGADEAERAIYPAFRAAANSLSQLYTLSMSQHRAAFHEGERHAMEKLYEWILRQHEEKARLTIEDIKAYIQHEINYGDDPSASLRSQLANQHLHNAMAVPISENQLLSGPLTQLQNLESAARCGHSDQSKNSDFLNTFSSSVRRNLHPYQLEQVGGCFSGAVAQPSITNRNQELIHPATNRWSHSPDSNDADMHSDSPSHGLY